MYTIKIDTLMAPTRMKNLTANESVSSNDAALRDNLLTDRASEAAEINRLKLLNLKLQLGVVTQDQVNQLLGPSDPVDILARKILIKLNKMSTLDSRLIHIFSIFGTKSRAEINKRLAEKYVASQTLKHTLRSFLGSDLNSIGEEEVYRDLGREDALDSNPMSTSQARAYASGSQQGRRSQRASGFADV